MEQSLPLVNLSRRAVLTAAPLGVLMPRVVLGQTTPVAARPKIEDALPQLDRLAQQAMGRTGVPGVAIAIVHQERIAYLKGFGLRGADKPGLVNPDTVFQLASLSKPVAATVVAALVGDRLIGWDDPIIRHDPGFAMYDPWVTSQVTLRDMLAHRSGLPDHAGDPIEDVGYERAAILYRLRYQKPNSSFRARYAYTNFGFTEAAVAAAKASGKSWEDLSADRLYRPLGMTHTSSRFADFTTAENRAYGHVRLGGQWVAKFTRDADAQSPAGGTSSSIRDMAQWLRLQLGRGKVGDKQIVAASALDETHRPQIIRTPPPDPAVDHAGFYGLGWNVDYDAAGRVRWSHSGAFDLGASTCVTLLPKEALGIVVLTNTQPIGVAEALSRSFFDLALDGKIEQDWFALYADWFARELIPDYRALDYAKAPMPPSPALPVAAYLGTYGNELYGPIEIAGSASDPGLVLKLGPKQDSYPLRHFDRDVFGYDPAGENAAGPSAVTFTIGADVKASEVTIANLDGNDQGSFRRATAAE